MAAASTSAAVALPPLGLPAVQIAGAAALPVQPHQGYPPSSAADGGVSARSPRQPLDRNPLTSGRHGQSTGARARKYHTSKKPTKRGTATGSYDVPEFEKVVPGDF